jgi:serine/threonine protein kinase
MPSSNVPLPEIVVTADPTALRAHRGARHRVIGPLGRGAMGEVLIAQDQLLQRQVALKQLDPSTPPDLAARFYNEVQITAQLDHPNIVPVYSIERPDGKLAYTMKLVRGRTLTEVLDQVRSTLTARRPLADEDQLPSRLDLFLQVCSAMAYAHGRGVIHRDLKPDNIMIGEFHDVLVMDWGIAKLIGDADAPASEAPGLTESPAHTRIGYTVGTPAYMSPEQAMGHNEALDARSDQYALGLILQEIVTLRRAIAGKSGTEAMLSAANGEREPVRGAGGERVPRELVAIVDKATAKAPGDRYANVDALADDIRRFLRDEAVLAQPDTVVQRMQRWISHHRERTLIIGVLLIVSVVGIGTTALVGATATALLGQYRAEQREHQLSDVLSMVSRQSHRMDSALHRVESLLVGLSFVGVDALASPDDDPELAEMADALRRTRLLSLRDAAASLPRAAQDEALATEPTPIVRAMAATQRGAIVSSPPGVEPSGDVTKSDWYHDAFTHSGPQWGRPEADGAATAVTVSIAVRDEADQWLGASAVVIDLDRALGGLVAPPTLAGAEGWLISGEGKVLLHTSPSGSDNAATFPWAPVVAAVHQGETSGYLELTRADSTPVLIAWSRLLAAEWTYVVEAPAGSVWR